MGPDRVEAKELLEVDLCSGTLSAGIPKRKGFKGPEVLVRELPIT